MNSDKAKKTGGRGAKRRNRSLDGLSPARQLPAPRRGLEEAGGPRRPREHVPLEMGTEVTGSREGAPGGPAPNSQTPFPSFGHCCTGQHSPSGPLGF